MKRSLKLSTLQLGGIFALISIVPLALLTYFSVSLASDAVKGEAKERMMLTATLSAAGVRQELRGLQDLVESYAARPSMQEALEDERLTPTERTLLRDHLVALRSAREGVYTTFLAKPDGTLIDIVPETPRIIGKNFAHRDWFIGLGRTGNTYVSRAYRTQAAGRGLVVAVSTYVRDKSSKQVAILVAAYSLDHLQDLAQLATAQNVSFTLTDQHGVVVAAPNGTPTELVSRRSDPRVASALSGFTGTVELDTPEGHELSAYAPIVPDIGWTVTASVPTSSAFEAVGRLRSTVFTIAGVLGLVLLGGVLLLIRILHERQRSREQAVRMANINRAVLDAAPDSIFLADSEGKLLLRNAALDRMSDGRSQNWVNGTVYEHLLEASERMVNSGEWRRAIEGIAADPDLTTDLQTEHTDGRTFHLYTAPVRDGVGGVTGRIFVGRDKTAEHEAERLKSELVATVSHELRTPLASILGFAELLVDRTMDEAKRERYLNTIHSEARRLTELINDFLDLQKIEEGNFTLALEPFGVEEVLREQVDLFRAQSEQHELELVVPSESIGVLGERERIAQVTSNLISNAIKYSPKGGRVEVRAEDRDGVVRISVSDEGLGIPADQQRMLFTKFFRVDSSDTRSIGGTGLGLALCREIVEAHGGRIGFDSVEGEGSTFWFELPAPAQRQGGGPRRVLVIEDEPAAASLLTEYIQTNGYEVEVAATGEQGLASAIDDPPALICLDIVLPGELDGWQVLTRLRERPDTAEIPVIVCTGKNGRDKASALGVTDFIAKPFSGRQIREAVQRLLPEGRGSVLVVDDDPAVRRLVSETLGGNGIELRESADGEAALAEVAARKPDALILDLMLPGIDGFTVLERLQENPETKQMPVVVLTARSLSSDERARLQQRAVSLLEKSTYSPQELRALVDRALVE